jgi:hypothetical protein
MADDRLGDATIVYEGPDGTTEETVPNSHLAYVRDHWLVKTGEDDGGDTVLRVPAERVYHVERTVDAFEEELDSVKDHVRSITDDLRDLLPGSGESRRGGPRGDRQRDRDGPVEIEVQRGAEPGDDADADAED